MNTLILKRIFKSMLALIFVFSINLNAQPDCYNSSGCGNWSQNKIEYHHPPNHPECYVTYAYKTRYCLVNGKNILQTDFQYLHFLDPFNNCTAYYATITDANGNFIPDKVAQLLNRIYDEIARIEFLYLFTTVEGTLNESLVRCPNYNYVLESKVATCSRICSAIIPYNGTGEEIVKAYLSLIACGDGCVIVQRALCMDLNNQVQMTTSYGLPYNEQYQCPTPVIQCEYPQGSIMQQVSNCTPFNYTIY